MTNLELENFVLGINDRIGNRQPNEDSRVELKSEWPADISKAARRLAGHANSARGELIIWVIGLDEKRGIIGAKHEELASWWPRLQAQFNGLAPTLLKTLNVTVGEHTLVALLFDAIRFPYVVKNPEGGQIQFEVPWREGTATRTATREDLVRLVSPLQCMPSVEVLGCNLHAWTNERVLKWRMEMFLYVVSNSDDDVIIPNHRCHASFEILGFFPHTRLKSLWPDTNYTAKDSNDRFRNVRTTGSEVIIQRAGMFILRGDAETENPGEHSKNLEGLPTSVAVITVQMFPAQVDVPAVITARLPAFLQKNLPNSWGIWKDNREE